MAYALDCEMIAVSLPSSKKLKSIAARVSIVDSYGMVVIDEYCQPPYEVYSYNTDYSGITPDNLIGKMSYAELRSIVSSLIENRLIVGHDLKNDFRALDINHPREFRFDTANDRTLRELANLPIDKKPKLARLTYRLTGRIIQLDTHDSVEDARAAMVLYNIVSQRRLSVHPMVVLRISNSMLPTQERVHDFVYESARAPMISQKTASPRSRNTASRSLVTRIQNWIQNLQILVFLVLLATLLCQLFSSKQAS